MWTHINLKNIIRIFLLTIFVVSIPVEEAQANRLWDFFYKRYLKRSKMKKWVPRLLGNEIPLEDLEVNDKYEVIGYEPSWLLENNGTFEEKKTYYFNLMTTLVSGEYDINPDTGMPRSEKNLYAPLTVKKRNMQHEGQHLSVYQTAYNENTRIKLLVSLNYSGDFGKPSYRSRYEANVITNNDVFEVFKDQLDLFYSETIKQVKIKPERLGIIVDFDFSDPNSNKEYFLEFLTKIHERFPKNLIYLKIPPLIRSNSAFPVDFIQDLLEMEDEIIDMFVMEAYGFEKSSGKDISSVHFDKNAKYSIESSIDYYCDFEFEEYDEDVIKKMGDFFKERLVLEFPYYGPIWERDNKMADYKLKKKNRYISYDKFWSEFVGKAGTMRYSEDSMSVYSENELNQKAYAQDSLTFFRKTHYVVDSLKLKGFGLNAIGYYKDKPGYMKKKIKKIWYGYANVDSFITQKKEHIGWIIAYFIVAFIPIGFIYSVGYYWEVRNALAKHKKYFTRFRAFFVLFLVIFLVVADIIPRGPAGLIVGTFLLICLLLYIIVKKVIVRSKKYVNALK